MKILLLLVAFFLAQAAYGLEGTVVGVHDGDTITVLDSNNTQHKIRLAQIDAPELSQEWGTNSKKALSDLVFGKFVNVEIESVDRYGREVGEVFLGDKNICHEQVKTGDAWVYVKYAHDLSLRTLEANAQKNKVGLWSTGDAEPPWRWRKHIGNH
ncbi:MAG: thermonuclease family protein [Gammaproteobacteria bacterium]|nr:thermonuclease family protein [Gammaproteobacteria bacterium]